MFTCTMKRVAGACVAAITLSLVASVAPATAAAHIPQPVKIQQVEIVSKKDSGWG